MKDKRHTLSQEMHIAIAFHEKLSNIEYRQNIFQHDRGNRSTVSTVSNGERLETLTPRSRTQEGCSLSALLFNKFFKVFSRFIRQEKQIKGKQVENQTFLHFA